MGTPTVAPTAKSILASKTFWFNVVAGAIGICQQAGLFEAIPQPYGTLALILGNIGLRFLTTQPVTVTGTP